MKDTSCLIMAEAAPCVDEAMACLWTFGGRTAAHSTHTRARSRLALTPVRGLTHSREARWGRRLRALCDLPLSLSLCWYSRSRHVAIDIAWLHGTGTGTDSSNWCGVCVLYLFGVCTSVEAGSASRHVTPWDRMRRPRRVTRSEDISHISTLDVRCA